ncbi:MAG: WG repeat-containing protein [Hymenobacteraceae bacterium]|nr:WG repeat-containing protein [Hymenobacteraceae bacterium]
MPYRKGRLWGFSDTTGRLIIKPQFAEEPSVFINGYAASEVKKVEQALRAKEGPYASESRKLRFFNAQGDMVSGGLSDFITWTSGGLVKRPRLKYAGQPEVIDLVTPERAARFGKMNSESIRLMRRTLTDGSVHYVYETPAVPPNRPELVGQYLGEGCFLLEERNPSRRRYPYFSLIDGAGRNRTWRWDRYYRINPFSGGRATIQRSERMGAIDRHGKEVVPCKYASVSTFYHNRATVSITGPWQRENAQWGLIDTMGQLLLGPLQLPSSYPYPWPYVDEEGIVCFPATPAKPTAHFLLPEGAPPLANNAFDAAEGFSAGRAWVVRKGRVGLIDRRGRWVTPLAYDSLYYVLHERELGTKRVPFTGHSPARVKLDEYSDPNYLIGYRQGHYGIVDRRTGREVIPARYDWVDAGVTKTGFALLWRGGVRYLVTAKGREVCPFAFGSAVINTIGASVDQLSYPNPFGPPVAYVLITAPRAKEPAPHIYTGGRWPLETPQALGEYGQWEKPTGPMKQCFVDTLGRQLTAWLAYRERIRWSRVGNRLYANVYPTTMIHDATTGQLLDSARWVDPVTGIYAKRVTPKKVLYRLYKPNGQALNSRRVARPEELTGTGWTLAASDENCCGRHNILISPSGRLIQAPTGFDFVQYGASSPSKVGGVKIDTIPSGGFPRYISLNGKKLFE